MARARFSCVKRSIPYGLVLGITTLASVLARAAEKRYDSGGSEHTHAIISDAYRAEYHGHLSEAIADMNRALADQPNYAYAYTIRGDFYREMGLYDAAIADYDTASSFHPESEEPVQAKAELALMRDHPVEAMTYLSRASKMSTVTLWRDPYEPGAGESGVGYFHVSGATTASYLYADESIAAELLKQDDLALADMDQMLKLQPDFPAHVLAHHCYIAGVAGLTDMADLTCTQAIADDSHDLGDYNSLAFAHLKMKDWANAVVDYTKALYFRPDLTLSLYGRGIAKLKSGDISGGNADIAAATAEEPDIANIMKRLGAPTP